VRDDDGYLLNFVHPQTFRSTRLVQAPDQVDQPDDMVGDLGGNSVVDVAQVVAECMLLAKVGQEGGVGWGVRRAGADALGEIGL